MTKRRTIDIGVLALLHSLQHIYLNVLPPIYFLLRAEFKISTLQIGLIGSVLGVISILQGPASYLVERVGCKRLAMLSMLSCSAAIFLYSLAPSFEVLLVITGIFALSQVTFHPSTYAMVVQRASERSRGKYIAYHQVGGFLGSAIGTAAIAYLASIYGWRSALQFIPVVGFSIIIVFWKLVEDQAPGIRQPVIHAVSTNPTDSEKFRVTTSLLILIFGISIFSLGNLLNYVPLFLSEVYGETIVWAGIMSSIMHAVGSVSSLVGGIASDKFARAQVTIMVCSLIGSGLVTILLAIGHFSSILLLFVLVIYGVTRYFPVPAQHTLSSIVASGHPQGIGFSYTGIALGQIFSALLIGYFIDVLGARSAFLVCSVLPFIAGGTVLMLKRRRHLS